MKYELVSYFAQLITTWLPSNLARVFPIGCAQESYH